MRDNNNLRMTLKSALDNLWSRISGIFGTVNGRIDDAEAHIDSVESAVDGVTTRVTSVEGRMTTAESQITGLDNRVDDIEDAVDDLEGDTIKSITFNGAAVPKDAQGNVALQETDPTVPAWAKQVKAKTSDFTNDGDGTDSNSPFATRKYVQDNGGKIDKIQVNYVDQPIVNKTVNLSIPESIDDLADKPFVKFTESATQASICDVLDGMNDGSFLFFESWTNATAILLGKALPSQYLYGEMQGTILCTQQQGSTKFYYLLARYSYYEYAGSTNEESGVAISYLDVNDDVHETVHVYESSFIKDGGGGGGGGSGAVDTVTFNGIQHSPDASGDVSLTESDPTVPAWAKAASKPTYTAAEVGALPDTTPIPSKTSDLTNDSGFLTSSTGVSGVKGNAENSYRQGDVNITPANIGAVAKTGDTMTGSLSINATASEDPRIIINGFNGRNWTLYRDGYNNLVFAQWGDGIGWRMPLRFAWSTGEVIMENPLGTNYGGTGATTPAAARANLGITPANIGAAADSAAMQFRGWYPNGQSMLSLTPGYYQTSPNNLPSETFPSGINPYGTLCVGNAGYTHITYISVLGDFMIWISPPTSAWYVVQNVGSVPVSSGGTGMTDAETFTQYTTNIGTDVYGRIRISRWGKMYIAHIAGSCSIAITANVTPMLSLTDSNYAPNPDVYAVFSMLGNEPFIAYINSSGNLYSSKTIEQGTWIYGEIMWFAGK